MGGHVNVLLNCKIGSKNHIVDQGWTRGLHVARESILRGPRCVSEIFT